ncbi:MAG: zinc ribbon domain-containing protein [Rhodospirillaceae bacterium]|nr:zinc ribbon domain-containing protein [Rhodospirillaceae bacterium]
MGIDVAWILVLWIVIPLAIGLVANSRGRSFIGWFLYALLIWPVALIHLLLIGRTEKGWERKARVEGRVHCPHCAEFIQRQARVCPHCRKDVRKSPATTAAGQPNKRYRGVAGYPGARI